MSEARVAGGERGSHHPGELSGVVGGLLGAWCLFQLGEERTRLLGLVGGELGGGRRCQREHAHVGDAACPGGLDQPVGGGR